MKKYWKPIVGIFTAVTMSLCVMGCGAKDENTKIVLTTGFAKDELFRIGSVSCSQAEFMVYLTNTQNQYENVYGSEIWKTSVGDITLEDNIKDTVLAKIAQIKTMYLLAKEHQISLTDSELQSVKAAAKQYFDSLNETEIASMNVTQEVIENLYVEYAHADKVYHSLIADINPEISDDEARTITVEHILFKTYIKDGAGNRVDYSDSMKEEIYKIAEGVYEKAISGEESFTELAREYSGDATIRYSFGKGELDPVFEEAAFRLGTDEISEIVETSTGYEIIKCISTFDVEETDANKIKIVEKRKNEAFGNTYDAFVATLVRNLNETLWEEISLIESDMVSTDSFYDVYNEHLQFTNF